MREVLSQRAQAECFDQVLAQRLPFYEDADLVLDTSDKSVEYLVEQVIAWMEKQAGESV